MTHSLTHLVTHSMTPHWLAHSCHRDPIVLSMLRIYRSVRLADFDWPFLLCLSFGGHFISLSLSLFLSLSIYQSIYLSIHLSLRLSFSITWQKICMALHNLSLCDIFDYWQFSNNAKQNILHSKLEKQRKTPCKRKCIQCYQKYCICKTLFDVFL